MTQPENYTAAQASDPQTSGQTLADIAAQRPDLRPAIAANPSTYPALLDWLKGLGDPAVDAALAARDAATQVLPVESAPAAPAQPEQPIEQAPVQPEQPTQVLPAPEAPAPLMTPPAQPAAPFAAPAPTGAPVPTGAPAPYGAPAPAPYGATAPYGAPAPGYQAGPGYPGVPGQPPAGIHPGGVGAPPAKSNKTLWIVLIVVALVIAIGVAITIVVVNKAKEVVDDANDDISDILDDIDIDDDIDAGDPQRFGDDPELDALYTACGAGDWEACDDLYWQAPRGTEYWDFGDTCGGAWEASTTTLCVEAMNEDEPDDVDTSDLSQAETLYLDALQEACANGDWSACDELYLDSPWGSDYEEFGDTCGGLSTTGNYCRNEFGDGVEPDFMTFGSHAGFDALMLACEEGVPDACDLLYQKTPIGSEYEAFAQERR